VDREGLKMSKPPHLSTHGGKGGKREFDQYNAGPRERGGGLCHYRGGTHICYVYLAEEPGMLAGPTCVHLEGLVQCRSQM
jgi:hypothetical protein